MKTLYDQFIELKTAGTGTYTYNNKQFHYRKFNVCTEITDYRGYTAITKHYINSFTDLQGMAACLLKEGRNIEFNKEGNII